MALVRFVNVGLAVRTPAGVSILQAARSVLAPVGSHCGGVGACTKCHVYVLTGAAHLRGARKDERELLTRVAQDCRAESRLACQAVVVADGGVVEVAISDESFRQYTDATSDDDRARVIKLWQDGAVETRRTP